ncbi:MAG: sugar-binding transcriptional regulator [Streptococcaceae bacterium]|jgi:DNA-binding transcriptional regulator LsrR (DeoR family)|nr:sugar-binding transcriptional regulator [Streptococcaceae bacterium]
MKDEKRNKLIKVAYMYYIEQKSQNEIANETGIYRTTISRMLTQARNEGIVEIKIHGANPEVYELENYLKEKYHLKAIKIVPSYPEQTRKEQSAKFYQQAATFIRERVDSNQTIGLSWGETIANVINQMKEKELENSTFVPLAGGPSQVNAHFHINTLVYNMSRIFRSNNIFINATVVQESKQMAEGILNAKYFHELRKSWANLDVAIVGIGGPLSYARSQWRDLLTQEDLEELRINEAVGEVCCRFYNQKGKIIKGSLDERTISLSLSELTNVPTTIALVNHKEKAEATLIALKNNYFNCLVINQDTAKELLHLDKNATLIE